MNRSAGTASIMLHERSELHPLRKLWHVGTGLGLYVILFHSGISRTESALLLLLLLIVNLGLELARLRMPAVNRIVLLLFGPLMRPREVRRLSGTPFYLAGTLTAILVFPEPVAKLALLFLALGDPAASAAGVLSGGRGPWLCRGKSLIGTAAAALVCMIVTVAFFVRALPSPEPGVLLLLGLGGGLAAGAAELAPVPVDDNLTIPVLSGLLFWPVYALLV